MGNEKIMKRISVNISESYILDALVDKTSLTDLQSLLLETYRRKTGKISCSDMLKQYKNNRFVKPSNASPFRMAEIDMAAMSLLPDDFAVLELSPLSPLGCASVLGPVNQNNIVTTTRNTEVCSDLTNVLALECAVRREKLLKEDIRSNKRVKLCSSQRLVRAQPTDNPNSFAHFRLFGLCTSGRDEGCCKFEKESLYEHLTFYIKLIDRLKSLDYKFSSIIIELIVYDPVFMKIAADLDNKINEMNCTIHIKTEISEKYKQTYYKGMGFHLHACNSTGEKLFLADAGFTDWTQNLLNNKKERLLISGLGTERVVHCF